MKWSRQVPRRAWVLKREDGRWIVNVAAGDYLTLFGPYRFHWMALFMAWINQS